MARCGCAADCLCAVVGGPGVSVVGNGSQSSPYAVSAKLDPAAGNLLTATGDGLRVSAAPTDLFVADSDCIDLSGVGSQADPLVASPKLKPGGGLTCDATGLSVADGGGTGYNVVTNVDDPIPAQVAMGDLVVVSGSSDVTVNLPPAAIQIGGVVVVKNLMPANSVTVVGYATQVIFGASPTLVLPTEFSSATLASMGDGWVVIGSI